MSVRFCEQCGEELLPNAAFCEACGAGVAEVTAPATPAQPQVYQRLAPPQEYSQPEPSQMKSGLKGVLVILAVVILTAAVVTVLWITGVIGGGEPEGDPADTPNSQTVQPAEKPDTQITPDPSATASPETDESPGVNGESLLLSTTETPVAGDFTWFTDKAERWVYGITPVDAYTLEDFYALLGSWKGLSMVYDYDGTLLGQCYFTATFNESGPNVAATLDWHFIDWDDGSREELTDREDETMTGSFAPPTLALGEEGNRIELILYAMDGKQYAEGKWTVQSGEEVRVALVRP